MTYRQFVPERRLRPFVHAFWTLTGVERTPVFDLILPDGRAELVVHRGDPFRQRLEAGQTCLQASAFVAGQMESAVAIAPGHAVETLGVTFTPCGLAPLCEAPQHALVDRLVDVRDVATPGLRRLVADVSSAPSLPAALELVQRGLARLYESVRCPIPGCRPRLPGSSALAVRCRCIDCMRRSARRRGGSNGAFATRWASRPSGWLA